jgi:hypothetical protein
MVDGRADGREPVEVVQLAAGAEKTPLFVLPSSVGQGSLDRAFTHGLDGDRPVFELRANYQDERFRGAADLSAHCAEVRRCALPRAAGRRLSLCGYSWADWPRTKPPATRGAGRFLPRIIDAEPFVKRRKITRARRLWYFLRNFPHWYWDHFRLHADRTMLRRGWLHLRSIVTRANGSPADLFARIFGDLDLPDELRAAVTRNIELVRTYAPPPYAGPLTLFRARARPLFPSILSFDSGWREVATGPFEVVQLKCHHSNILSEPHLTTLVRILRDRMGLASAQRP